MKKIIYLITYIAAFVMGVILLIFNHQSVEESQPVLRPTIIAAGIVFVIPGLVLLSASLVPGKNKNGVPWISTATGIIALVWGILMLSMPGGFLGNLNITLGVSLIIAAIAQTVWIIRGRRTNGAPVWLYIIPLIVILAGVAIVLLRVDYQNPGHDRQIGCVISGIAFIMWAANGFMSLPRRKHTAEELARQVRRLSEKQEKTIKAEAIAARDEEKCSAPAQDSSYASPKAESSDKGNNE